ncbi:dihydrolipoamide acetyltransferase family protein [Pontibacterium sp.]|uniref:dihydrolipoamide acetyltransferase family protein n=1 Tax=Pontibacterium sp. TaxID=2036026 RepID=UPI00351875F7
MNELTMPSFGADMESGVVSEWRIKPGDRIQKGDIIAVIETNKGAIDMETFQTGTVHELLVEPGSRVPVGTPIATLSDDKAEAPSTDSVISTRPKASPLARKQAQVRGIDLRGLSGSGPDGAILAADLPTPIPHRPEVNTPVPGDEKEMMRRAIAAAMVRSKREIPHYYLATTIDLQTALEWMTQYNHDKPADEQLLMTALLHKAIALALLDSPELNGFYQHGQFQSADEIHLGMAISIRTWGLITPALHRVDRAPLPELMQRMRDLTLRARRGGLRSSEMTDATITVSSMGERGVETLFGVIYPPQVALIGIGCPQTRPWVVNGAVCPRLLVNVSLAADHRVSDGHQGAQFLRRVTKLLQHPERLLD